MQQFIDNLISRLEEKIFSAELHDYGWEGQTAHNLLTLGDVRDAAEQLAKEYKGGWIPCSERLPEEPEENPELDYKPLELYLVSIPGVKYPFRAFWNGECFTDGWYKVDAVAWMPLPSSYQPEK